MVQAQRGYIDFTFLAIFKFLHLFSLLLAGGEELQHWMMLPLDLRTMLGLCFETLGGGICLDYALEIFCYYAHLFPTFLENPVCFCLDNPVCCYVLGTILLFILFRQSSMFFYFGLWINIMDYDNNTVAISVYFGLWIILDYVSYFAIFNNPVALRIGFSNLVSIHIGHTQDTYTISMDSFE
jgi:hypothetical protein